jgi:hypothetical protein
MRSIGYSTGAIAKSDFGTALKFLSSVKANAVELSALRLPELPILLEAVPSLHLADYHYIAFHAPSNFSSSDEVKVVHGLSALRELGWPIIVHPDVISTPRLWAGLGTQLCIENMDQRKAIGQTSAHLKQIFSLLPNATLCLDLAHVQQVDPTMLEAIRIIHDHGNRLRQLHMSNLDAFSKHHRINRLSLDSFATVCSRIPETIPIILESPLSELLDSNSARQEISLAERICKKGSSLMAA